MTAILSGLFAQDIQMLMASDGAAKTDSALVSPKWAANRFKQTNGHRSITFVQSRLTHKMTSILVPVSFRKYSNNSEHSTIYSGNMILLDRVPTLTHQGQRNHILSAQIPFN